MEKEPLVFGRHQVCPRCQGSGKVPAEKGQKPTAGARRTDQPPATIRCSRCAGEGVIK